MLAQAPQLAATSRGTVVNTDAQYLSTFENLGYVVIGVDSAASQSALNQLRRVPGTIRCRILY